MRKSLLDPCIFSPYASKIFEKFGSLICKICIFRISKISQIAYFRAF
ncbi:hypothetical protein UNSWCS_1415 [Campylobacter concisus UNSWCS]|uniref:Uncharacterized protein n=1 Tax=Campylobacter concisus UNSWCS TaxID=1242968 RepID=U2GLD3_9BACT|nr:hypothetical protein UNSWCS_1415 [Campylobacter concisus UNSWCS]